MHNDLTGLAVGNSKTKMLEFRIADSLAECAAAIVMGMAVQFEIMFTVGCGVRRGGDAALPCAVSGVMVNREQVLSNHLLQRLFGSYVE